MEILKIRSLVNAFTAGSLAPTMLTKILTNAIDTQFQTYNSERENLYNDGKLVPVSIFVSIVGASDPAVIA